MPTFERARSAEAKRARETAILGAATRLATEHGVRAVTLTDIATAVGMHKSAMLRYFETREEIFLRLSGSAWTEWSADIRGQLAGLDSIPAIAAVLAETLAARPLFCDLLAHTPLNLERGVSFPTVKAFKVIVLGEVKAVADALTAVLPITATQAGDVVATATSMAGALWQMAASGTELRAFYAETPELTHALVDVGPRLTGILAGLLRGYSRQDDSDRVV
jgi:AcrR family transcriptional regulator